MKNRGMTIVELLFASIIFSLIAMVAVYVTVMASRMTLTSTGEAELVQEAKYVLDLIQEGEDTLQGIVKARAATLAVGADLTSITFSVDRNATYTTSTADDTQMSVALDGTTIVIDPDTAVAGNSIAVGENVEDLVFNVNGDFVSVSMTLMKTVRGDPMRVNLSRDIWVRN